MVVNEQVVVCAGCDQRIQDRYLLQVTNRKWHCDCLRCTFCKCQLNEKCWVKQGNLYCKEDYYKLFFSCNNCKHTIERDTLVRKAGKFIYHLQCFHCFQCNKVLDSGDHYMLQKNKLICSSHYPHLISPNSKSNTAELMGDAEGELVVKTEQKSVLNENSNPAKIAQHLTSLQINNNHSIYTPSLNCKQGNSLFQNHSYHSLSASLLEPDNRLNMLQNSNLVDYSPQVNEKSLLFDYKSDYYSPHRFSSNNLNSIYEQDQMHFYETSASSQSSQNLTTSLSNSLSNANCSTLLNEIENSATNSSNLTNGNARKGRPRKRKQLNLVNNTNSEINSLHENVDHQNLNRAINSNGLLQNSNSNGPAVNSGNNHPRTKRMRTSFKHQQLKSMKFFFASNQNPDAKDLKGLSQKTGLSKRVLQVWFQNARAKWRRSNPKGKEFTTGHNMQIISTCLGSPEGSSTRQFSTPSPASIISNNSISNTSNNQSSNNSNVLMQCRQSLNQTNLSSNHSLNVGLISGSTSSLDQYSPSNSISLLRQTPPSSVKMQSPNNQQMLNFGYHLSPGQSNSLIKNLEMNLTSFW